MFAFADQEIARAAAGLWPRAAIASDGLVPSVTGYVRRIRVDDRTLYAKYSFLGVSLVSLLRGACGGWAQVRLAQQAYVSQPGSLMEREAAQLRLMAEVGRPKVCAVAGVERGVLFTEPVTGLNLADLLLQRPEAAASLLCGTFAELCLLHHPPTARRLGPAGVIGERSIAGTFQRKFNGISGRTYLDRLGAERCASEQRQEVAGVLRQVVARLRRMRGSLLPQGRRVLAYGDLKPEHVAFPHGPGGRPVFIDPGLLLAGTAVDAAKLISRTVLLLAAARPGADAGQQTAEGLSAFADARMRGLSTKARRGWLRELLALWLMDTVNILTTYLSAPPALPLPGQAAALVDRAVEVCRMANRISTQLAASAYTRAVWEQALAEARAVAS
ncbi:hypothetical protein AB0E27_41230 [Streptomyces sparsogenes]|uniref:hypothetical protein n=1 Tax=Streptomyces sparsogenes TaxID=67365 RepID=UPI0033CA65C3